jgi:A/G-specific adenine glycosylase
VFLRKRTDSGLLGGMTEVPGSAWTARIDGETGIAAAPFPADWQASGTVTHVFTHFELRLTVYRSKVLRTAGAGDGWWQPKETLDGEALPTVMKKAIKQAIPDAFQKARKA